MKKSYLAFLCLLGAWGASAQTVNVKPISELHTSVFNTKFHKVENPIEGMSVRKLNTSKSPVTNQFIPKSLGCVDTLSYPYMKQYANNIMNSQSGTSNFKYDITDNTLLYAQVYKTGSTPLKINGLEFIIGKTTPDLNNAVTVRYSILQLNGAGTPTGTVLGSVDYTIPASADTLLDYHTANFSTPISVSSDFAIELKVVTVTEVKVYISDDAVHSTFDEQLLYLNPLGLGAGYATAKSLYQNYFGQNFDYDMIVHPFVSYDMDVPSFTATPNSGCTNTTVNFNATFTPSNAETNRFLNRYAFSDYFNLGDPNGTKITAPLGNGSVLLSTNPATHQYTSAGVYNAVFQYTLGFQSEDCFAQKTTSVTIDNPSDATFSYGGVTTFCKSSANEIPTKATNGGTFSSTAGLLLDATTGEIDFANSNVGTYVVQYEIVNGVCTSSTTQTVSVVNSADATFSFAQNTYCLNDVNPTAVLGTGATVGTFSSMGGLVINGTTGEIDLANSTAGTYVVTNTISPSGACLGDVQTTSVTLNANPTVTFDAVAPLCISASAVTLNVTPNTGTFSGNGVTNGDFDPADAGIGNHTVSYSVTDNGCTTVETISIAVSNTEIPDFTYANSEYCKNDSNNPTVVLGTGATAGTFTTTAGLVINAATGEIDLANSTVGSFPVTNTVNETNGCAVATATQIVEIKTIPSITFTMPATICINHDAITLSATPTGGSFTGAGVASGSFNPATAGAGVRNVSYSVTENGCSNSETRSITVDECLSLNDIVTFKVSLFPVPATNDLTITISEDATAQIMNLEGKVIVDNIRLSANTNNFISTENYARGMYLVKISANGQAVIKKITLE